MTASDGSTERTKKSRLRSSDDLVWCDKLGSTPAIGFSFEPHFISSSTLLDAAASLTDEMVEDGQRVRFTIDRQDQFSVSFSTFTGFNYTFDSFKVSVVFQHRMRIRRQSGGPPAMHMESIPRPYSTLLKEVSDRSVRAANLLPGINTRKLTRIGIMSTTAVAKNELPPGISSLISYQSKAWRGPVTSFQIQFTITLGDTDEFKDRCIFTVNLNEDDEDQLVTVQLDWQRTFNKGKASSSRSLDTLVGECQIKALSFFESLGDGAGYNENIYR